MSQEHEKSSPVDAPAYEGIHTEPPPFEPGYQPESLPQISVPDLPPDAQGLTAEALLQVPTLTELVSTEPVAEPAPTAQVAVEPDTTELVQPIQAIQDTPAQADTWVEELHVRMGKLTDDIHTLNARLDRLDARNKTKV